MTKFRRRRSAPDDTASTEPQATEPNPSSDGSAPAAAAPVDPPRHQPLDELADLTVIEAGTPTQRAEQYNAWAERLKQKRARAKEVYATTTSTDEPAAAPTSAHWTAEAVFAESRRLEEAETWERPDPRRAAELLAVLGLQSDATALQVGDAYRRLAKKHHPDRFAAAEAEVQDEHADRMAEINRAYAALKKIDRA